MADTVQTLFSHPIWPSQTPKDGNLLSHLVNEKTEAWACMSLGQCHFLAFLSYLTSLAEAQRGEVTDLRTHSEETVTPVLYPGPWAHPLYLEGFGRRMASCLAGFCFICATRASGHCGLPRDEGFDGP